MREWKVMVAALFATPWLAWARMHEKAVLSQ